MTSDMRDVFEETMTGREPPLSMTTDDILAAGRRKQATRRFGWVGGGAVALVAAVVVSASLALPESGGSGIASPADETTSESPAVSADGYQIVETWGEYSDVVRELFVEQAPDYLYENSEQDPLEMSETGQFSSSGPDPVIEIPHTGAAFLKTADGTPVGSVGVWAYEPGPWEEGPSDDPYWSEDPTGGPIVSCWSGETDVHQGGSEESPVKVQITDTECEDTTTPDGDRMIRLSRVVSYENEEPGSYENIVVVYRADDTAVVVTSFCGNEDEDDEYGGTCHDIQFDLDQLTAIALELPAVIVTDDGQ